MVCHGLPDVHLSFMWLRTARLPYAQCLGNHSVTPPKD